MTQEKIFLVKTTTKSGKWEGFTMIEYDNRVELTKEEIEDIRKALGFYGCDVNRFEDVKIILKKLERI